MRLKVSTLHTHTVSRQSGSLRNMATMLVMKRTLECGAYIVISHGLYGVKGEHIPYFVVAVIIYFVGYFLITLCLSMLVNVCLLALTISMCAVVI